MKKNHIILLITGCNNQNNITDNIIYNNKKL